MAGRYHGLRRFAAVTAYALGAGWGAHAAIGRDPAGDLALPLGLVAACAVWCAADARARGRPLLWPARVGLLLSGAAGVPVYLWWSRGARGLGTAALVAAAWFGAVAVGVVAGAVVAAGAGYSPAGLGRHR